MSTFNKYSIFNILTIQINSSTNCQWKQMSEASIQPVKCIPFDRFFVLSIFIRPILFSSAYSANIGEKSLFIRLNIQSISMSAIHSICPINPSFREANIDVRKGPDVPEALYPSYSNNEKLIQIWPQCLKWLFLFILMSRKSKYWNVSRLISPMTNDQWLFNIRNISNLINVSNDK